MSTSAIYILDLKGTVLISRDYRGDLKPHTIDKFMTLLTEKEEEGSPTPIIQGPGCSFAYIQTNNLYIVSVSTKNANVTMVLVLLHKIASVMNEYFKTLEEESIRDNFVIIYELLDEMVDFGYPQTTDGKILKEYITQQSLKLERNLTVPQAVTNAVSWRSESTKHRRNEVFLDVVESVNLLTSPTGIVLYSEICGVVKMKVFLSGMPELRLGLNDKILYDTTGKTRSKSIELEDVKFHQCVRLSRFETDRSITFVPPDGDFELMSYRINSALQPLIWINTTIEEHAHSRVEYLVIARAQFKKRSTAQNVVVIIPVLEYVDSPKFKTSVGTAVYDPSENHIKWNIKSFPGGKEFVLKAQFQLPSIEDEASVETKTPVQVKFEIPYFTISGIQVKYLKIIEKSGYHALPWVRYITQNGDYLIRVS